MGKKKRTQDESDYSYILFFFNIKNTFKLKYKNGNKSLLNKLTCGSVVSHITVLPGVGK